ncbi:hypothetical protein ACH4E7_06800 [Kitasatospora sp. NPDC018058]|uniref:hypothetical protein n=1 Tax=Kitasatospora sp. NPDC018058 TaxID=3364025 RepID=UPI0037BFEF2C
MTIDISTATRIPLPGGAWADLRPVSDITERHRRPIRKLSTGLLGHADFAAAVAEMQASGKDPGSLTPDEQLRVAAGMGSAFDDLEAIQDLLVVAAVRGWSFDAVPITVDGLLDLPGQALDALRAAVAPYQSALNPNLKDPSPDPQSPTVPSSA